MSDNQVYSGPVMETNEALRKFMLGIYLWMTLGIAITGLVAYITVRTPVLLRLIASSNFIFFGLIIFELALVFFLSMRVMKMSPQAAIATFLLYSAINGLTLSVVFLAYTQESIARVFFITSGTFAAMSAYGYFTKKDLSGWGKFLIMGLIGVIIASIVNFFIHSNFIYWISSIAGVLIFVGLTAYDTWRFKKLFLTNEDQLTDVMVQRITILAALHLYLDFINLFLFLLRFLGRRK
jgi:FtsH-binding integral membrane protein